MGIEALLIGISLFEVGMLYWLLCGTVLEKRYFQKKDWVILCASIVGIGINAGGNRSLIFFSRVAFIVCVVATCICAILISKNYHNYFVLCFSSVNGFFCRFCEYDSIKT